MKKTFEVIQIFLVIAASLFILSLPAYLHYTEMSQIRFVSSDLSLENPNQEEALADSEKELNGYGLIAFLMMFLLSTNLIEHSSYSFQALSLRQRIVVLRC